MCIEKVVRMIWNVGSVNQISESNDRFMTDLLPVSSNWKLDSFFSLFNESCSLPIGHKFRHR